MKTLYLHCDYIRFAAQKKALKNVDDIAGKQTEHGDVLDCLVVMIAVEKGDTPHATVDALIAHITDIAAQVKATNIVLYPYAHLSKNLSAPDVAVEILTQTKKRLPQSLTVTAAPFGYYKSFELKVKGHPLSELAREITPTDDTKHVPQQKEQSADEVKQLLRQITKAKLDTSKLKENDHRIIGSKMDLWSFNSVAPGMVFWHDKGLHIKNKLIEHWREIQREAGYQEISTPQVMDKKLWEVSGHWSKYGENNFKTSYEGRDFLVKPMNCPGGVLVYKTSPKSYRDLPLRLAEMGVVHRVELSGVLAGLFRVIQFTQDDAHVFCTEEQLESEVRTIIDLITQTFALFDLTFDHVELSTRPEKRIGSDNVWDFTEQTLEKILKRSKLSYKINAGDGAFYGPKIDFHVKDSLGRTWQCATIQMDMAMPERFDVTYTDTNGKEKRPIMLHRVIYGSLERFIGIITEHVNGNFPLWMNPNQIMVATMNDAVLEYANSIHQKLHAHGFRVILNDKNESMAKKAREAQVEHFNYLVTVGEKEEKSGQLAVRKHGSKDITTMKIDDFIAQLKEEIRTKIR